MNDDLLIRLRPSPRPEFAAALYRKISQPVARPSRFATALRRTMLASAALAAVLTVILLVSPLARAFADHLVRQIGAYTFIGGLTLPDASKAANVTTKKSINKPLAPPDTLPSQAAPDVAKASALAGFAVRTPAYVPAGYTPKGDWSVETRENGVLAVCSYVNVDGEKENHFLSISQLKPREGSPNREFHVSEEQMQDVIVRGAPGVWLASRGKENAKYSLVWAEDGITFSMSSDALSLEEMLKIAESLGK